MFHTQGLEEDGVTAFVERKKVLANRRQTVKHLQDLCSLYYLQRIFSAVITVTGFYSIQVSVFIQESSVTHTHTPIIVKHNQSTFSRRSGRLRAIMHT